jgi:hypothetical protein
MMNNDRTGMSLTTKLLIGGAVVAAASVGYYLFTNDTRAQNPDRLKKSIKWLLGMEADPNEKHRESYIPLSEMECVPGFDCAGCQWAEISDTAEVICVHPDRLELYPESASLGVRRAAEKKELKRLQEVVVDPKKGRRSLYR